MYFNYNSDITYFSWGKALNGKGLFRDSEVFKGYKKSGSC